MRRFIAVWLLLVSPALQAGEPVHAPALAERLAGPQAPLVIDVRSPEEYAAGHVPGARLLPHDAVQTHVTSLDRSRELVLYCRSGRRARIAGEWLESQGYRVRYLDGDFPGWAAAGLPVETGTPSSKDAP